MTVDFSQWLIDQDAVRCIIVDADVNVAGSEITRKLSTAAYLTGGTAYDPIINAESVQFIERLSLDGATAISFGDIEIFNVDGELDSWLLDVWSNRRILVRIGDVRWSIVDFLTIMDGVVEDIGSQNETVLNLKIRDKMQRLNNAMSEAVLGGSTLNKAELIPLTFGECFNVTPLLTNPATLEYQVQNGAIESFVEVRDNGIPVVYTPSVSTGKFTLSNQPAGKITCSVQGDKGGGVYRNKCADLIQRIVTTYAGTQPFTTGDIDLSNFSTFNTANPQPMGIYAKSRENTISTIESLAGSIGSQLAMSRAGKLRLIKIELPAPGTPFAIDSDDVLEDQFMISDKLDVRAAYKLSYCKNWTTLPDLQTGIPAEHKEIYAQEWITSLSQDSTVKTKYKLTSEPISVETNLLKKTDADAESLRLLNLYKVPRFVISFTGLARLIQLELGQAVTITYPRFGCESGRNGQVVGLSINWSEMTVRVEVFV